MTNQAYPASFPKLGEPIGRTADGKDIFPNEVFIQLMESLFLRTGGDEDGAFVAAQNAARAQGIAIGIRDGTQTIADPNITNIGVLSERLTALEENNAQTATQTSGGSGALTATASPASVYKAGQGQLTSDPVTVTPQGGAGGETYAWLSTNPNITITDDDQQTTTFSGDVTNTQTLSGSATCVVTDTDGATYSIRVPITFHDPFANQSFPPPDSGGDPLP